MINLWPAFAIVANLKFVRRSSIYRIWHLSGSELLPIIYRVLITIEFSCCYRIRQYQLGFIAFTSISVYGIVALNRTDRFRCGVLHVSVFLVMVFSSI